MLVSAGAQARSILNSYRIDINNASNGVGLSRDAHLKRGYHKNSASVEVLSRIQNLPDAASVKTELENIGREMQNNTFKF
ncbi:MAG: AHH domain-containing protein [Leptolyngbya sp. SIO1E4]|nr:AHH domain-containing protein [Leptolyngbya sp. SIO1E4]